MCESSCGTWYADGDGDGRLPDGGATVVWDGVDDTGQPAASGVYFARAEAAGDVLTSKVVFIR